MEEVIDFILRIELNMLSTLISILIFIIPIIILISWVNSACNEIEEKRKRNERMLYGHELEEAEGIRVIREIKKDIREKRKIRKLVNNMEDYLTVEEYANMVGASYFTIIGYIRNDRLEAEKIAGRYFIKKDAKIKIRVPDGINSEFVEIEKNNI